MYLGRAEPHFLSEYKELAMSSYIKSEPLWKCCKSGCNPPPGLGGFLYIKLKNMRISESVSHIYGIKNPEAWQRGFKRMLVVTSRGEITCKYSHGHIRITRIEYRSAKVTWQIVQAQNQVH